jgi:hypothetical protein
MFLSLCGCGVLLGATRLFEGAVAFWVCNVFLRLLGCGRGDCLLCYEDISMFVAKLLFYVCFHLILKSTLD